MCTYVCTHTHIYISIISILLYVYIRMNVTNKLYAILLIRLQIGS